MRGSGTGTTTSAAAPSGQIATVSASHSPRGQAHASSRRYFNRTTSSRRRPSYRPTATAASNRGRRRRQSSQADAAAPGPISPAQTGQGEGPFGSIRARHRTQIHRRKAGRSPAPHPRQARG